MVGDRVCAVSVLEHRVATAQRWKESEEQKKWEHHHRIVEEIFFFLFYLCDLPGWGTPRTGYEEMAECPVPCSPLHGLLTTLLK